MAQYRETGLLSSCSSVICLEECAEDRVTDESNSSIYVPAVFSTGGVLKTPRIVKQKSHVRSRAKIPADVILTSESASSTIVESFLPEEKALHDTSKAKIRKMVSDVRAELSIVHLGPDETNNHVLEPIILNDPDVASPGKSCVFDDMFADVRVTGLLCGPHDADDRVLKRVSLQAPEVAALHVSGVPYGPRQTDDRVLSSISSNVPEVVYSGKLRASPGRRCVHDDIFVDEFVSGVSYEAPYTDDQVLMPISLNFPQVASSNKLRESPGKRYVHDAIFVDKLVRGVPHGPRETDDQVLRPISLNVREVTSSDKLCASPIERRMSDDIFMDEPARGVPHGPHEIDNRVLRPMSLNVQEVASSAKLCASPVDRRMSDDIFVDEPARGVPHGPHEIDNRVLRPISLNVQEVASSAKLCASPVERCMSDDIFVDEPARGVPHGPHEIDNRVLRQISSNAPEVVDPGKKYVVDDIGARAPVTGVPRHRVARHRVSHDKASYAAQSQGAIDDVMDSSGDSIVQLTENSTELRGRLKSDSVSFALAQLEAAQKALQANATLLASVRAQWGFSEVYDHDFHTEDECTTASI